MQTKVKWLLLPVLLLFNASVVIAQGKGLNMIYIGDSITAGAGIGDASNYPTVASDIALQKSGYTAVQSSNQGHSGYTTLDFQPGTSAFEQVENAANEYKGSTNELVFSIMLGTNDSAIRGPHGAPVSAENYAKNLRSIIGRLLKDYPDSKIVIQHPLWYSPNTYNGAMYLQEGLDRLQSYFPQIDHLVSNYAAKNKGHVFLGDCDAFDYFKTHYQASLQAEQGNKGIFYLHPNENGAKVLGEFWAKAIARAIR